MVACRPDEIRSKPLCWRLFIHPTQSSRFAHGVARKKHRASSAVLLGKPARDGRQTLWALQNVLWNAFAKLQPSNRGRVAHISRVFRENVGFHCTFLLAFSQPPGVQVVALLAANQSPRRKSGRAQGCLSKSRDAM
jgi:hypothetical protein